MHLEKAFKRKRLNEYSKHIYVYIYIYINLLSYYQSQVFWTIFYGSLSIDDTCTVTSCFDKAAVQIDPWGNRSVSCSLVYLMIGPRKMFGSSDFVRFCWHFMLVQSGWHPKIETYMCLGNSILGSPTSSLFCGEYGYSMILLAQPTPPFTSG